MRYPTGVKKDYHNLIHHGNRGMDLEQDINESNLYYRTHDIAVIHKKPTPITIRRVDYPSRKEAVIREAYFKTPSTTDYNGVYLGHYIDFEAKETRHPYFPLSNIHSHQIEHLKKIQKHGGIGFLIVRFSKENETYYLPLEHLLTFLKTNTRKSIPITYFQEYGYLIPLKFQPRLDYLQILKTYDLKGDLK